MALSDHGQYSGVVDIARNGIDEVIRLQTQAKQDEALIRQLVEALDECKDSTQERIDTLAESGIDKHKPRYFRSYVQDLQRAADAISAGRARLEGKP